MASESVQKLAAANNNFALDLYNAIRRDSDSENIFFAPFSVVAALAMTHLGARDSTAAQMKSALKLGNFEDAHLHETLAELTSSLRTTEGGPYVLHVANRLFAKHGYTFLEDFLTATRKHYKAEAQNVDFERDCEGARVAINKWVEGQTNEKIKDLFEEGSVDPMTAMVLVNAIYFKGDWQEQFDPSKTMKSEFFVSDSETIQVDMMHKHENFNIGFSDELNAKSIEFPYKNNELSMVCIIPNRQGALAELEAKLTAENIKPLLECPDDIKVMAFIPKFKVEHDVKLKKQLMALGMKDPFVNGKADFSGMDGSRNLVMSEVVHKAFIEVNEEGTEAAAATGVQIMLMCMPLEFNANHPFLFAIKDKRSGAVLFMGRVVRPTSA